MINEKKLSAAELVKREELIQSMKKNKRNLVKKYGSDAEKVLYGRATNLAKKLAEQDMEQNKLREMVKAALMQPVSEKKSFPDLTGDGKVTKADILKARGVELDEALNQAVVLTDEDHDRLMKNGSVAVNVGGETVIVALKNFDVDLEDADYESLDEEVSNDYSPLAYATLVANGKMDIEDAMKETGFPYTTLIAMVRKIKNLAQDTLKEDEAGLGLEEDLDLGHEDNEPHMIKAELYRIGKYAMELYQMVDGFEGEGEVDFPAWWQAKITTSMNNMVGAKHYLDFEIKEPAIDAMVGVASDEEILDNEIEEGIHDKDITSAPHTNVKGTMGDYDPKKRAANLAKLKNFGPKGKEIKEEEVGEVDKLAAKIAKALKSNTSDEDQNNIKQARKAMNDGNIEAAKKILQPYIKEGLPKGFWDKRMDDKDEVDESYNTLVNKIKKQGQSEKSAKAIAGAVASYKAKGGGKGPTAKQKG